MNDIDDVLVQVRDSLSGAHMDMPVDAILARSRSHQHRRRLAGLSMAGVAAGGVLALGLTGVFGSGSPSLASETIRTAAFTLVSNANGTDTLTLNQAQLFNPGALQRALAQDHIPALVQTGSICSSNPAPAANGVISPPLPSSFGPATSDAGQKNPVSPNATWVINPAAMPAGTELSFTYVNQDHGLFGGLIYDSGYTCSLVPAGS